MPANHFKNRPLWTQFPSMIEVGDWVQIIEKENQGTRSDSDLVNGQVKRVLSHGQRYQNGAKVELTSGHIGRVQYEGDPSKGVANSVEPTRRTTKKQQKNNKKGRQH